MKNKNKITLILPSCGLNYLWQLGGITALYELGLDKKINSVYGCSGGAWSSIFLGLGKEKLNFWTSHASDFYFNWQKQNKFKYFRRITCALSEDSYSVLDNYGFFSDFKPSFNCYFKLLQIYPKFKSDIVEVTHASSEYIHKLAIASSTIPLITGTVAKLENKLYLDGGFFPSFKKNEINKSDLKNTIMILDPYVKQSTFADFNISPIKRLSSGLKLGLPFQISKKDIDDIISNGYDSLMRKKGELLNHFSQYH